jgi:formylmethanofuran dehydrogenase subunit E
MRLPLVAALGASLAIAMAVACASPPAASPAASATLSAAAPEDALARVTVIHGGAGPWVVAGYRMGRYALQKLALPAQSFDLEVTHHTPEKVQYSCIADGAAAATGASMGKLNLKLTPAADADVMTTYRKKSTGQSLTLRPTAAFAARYQDLPREHLLEAGREVMTLPDSEVFQEVPAPIP